MPDYEGYVAEVAASAPPGSEFDAARLLRVSMQLAKEDNGGTLSMEHAGRLRDAALRFKPNAPTKNVDAPTGAASAFGESAFRSAAVAPVAAIMARTQGGDYNEAFRENTDRQATLANEHPVAGFAGDVAGGIVAPVVGAAAGGLMTGGNPLGMIAGGVAGGAPNVVAGDLAREQAGRGGTNRGLNAAVETAVNAIPGVGAATQVAARLGGKAAARAIGSGIEGGIMGAGQSAAQQGVDLSTGDREDFSFSEVGTAAVGGVAGGAIAHPASEALGKFTQRPSRIVDMDNPNGPTPVEPAEAPNIRGMDPAPSPFNNGVVVPRNPQELAQGQQLADVNGEQQRLELAQAQREADVGIRLSQERGVGIPQEQLVRDNLLAQRKSADERQTLVSSQVAKTRESLAARKFEQRDAEASMAYRDASQPDPVPRVSLDSAPVDALAPRPKTATELAEEGDLSGYQNVDEESPTVNPRKLDLPEDAQKVVDDANLTDAEFAKLRDEGLAGWDAHADLAGAAVNVDAAIKAVRAPPRKAKVAQPVVEPVVETEAKPRTFFRDDLGKMKEVTDRIDPKHYEGQTLTAYDTLSPVQQKQADAKSQVRRVTDRGAAINPAAAVVDTVKAVDRVLGVSDATKHAGKAVQSINEYLGTDAVDRVKNSSSASVRAVGEKLSEAIHHGKQLSQELHKDSTAALKQSATLNPKDALALRDASKAPTTGSAGRSALLESLEGQKPSTGYVARVKDSFTKINKSTFDLLKKNSVDFHDNGKNGKDVVVRHFTNDATRAFQGYDTAAMKNFADWMVANNKKPNGKPYTTEEVTAHFAHTTDEGTNAFVRLDPLEIGRKFPNVPDWVQGKSGWVRMLDLDPQSYIRRVESSAVNRVGFSRAMGPNTKMSDILEQFATHDKADAGEVAALKRALDSYNGMGEARLLSDTKGIAAHLKNVKQVYGALLTSAGAAIDATESTAILSLAPMQHGIRGVVEAVMHPKRAGREGGIEADIRTLTDLTGDARAVAGNVRGFLHRLSLRNAVNRANHIMAYETGRSWGNAMIKKGVSGTDEAFMKVNRIPESVQERFRSGLADPVEAIVLGVTLAQNMSGRKTNRAEQSRASRNDVINAFGPLFRQYGENRYRNLARAADTIAKEARNGNYRGAANLVVGSLLGVGGAAAAATAVAQFMKYGVEGLQMAFESGDQLIPFLANGLGGGTAGTVLQAQSGPNPTDKIVSSLSWIPSLAMALKRGVEDPAKEIQRAVPAVGRITTWAGGDGPGKKAYRVFREKESSIYGDAPQNAAKSAFSDVRANVRKAILSDDKGAFQTAMREATKAVAKKAAEDGKELAPAMREFIGNTMLLQRHMPSVGAPTVANAKKAKQFKELREAVGPTAYAHIRAYESKLARWRAIYED